MTTTDGGDVNAAFERELRELRSRLESTQHDMVGRLPAELKRILVDHRDLTKSDNAVDWAGEVAEVVLRYAKPRPAKEMNDFGSLSDRAFCPLCGRSSDNLHGEHGFSYPEGLRRHLLGAHTARECPVMEAAREIARDEIAKRGGGHA